MKTATLRMTLPEPTEAEIQSAAYHLWLESGCLSGRELYHWLAAKELLRHRHGHEGVRAPSKRRAKNPAAHSLVRA